MSPNKLFGGTWTWWFSRVESPRGVSPVDFRVPGLPSIFSLRMAGFCRGADDKSLGWMVDQGVWWMKQSVDQDDIFIFVKRMLRKCNFHATSMVFFPLFGGWWCALQLKRFQKHHCLHFPVMHWCMIIIRQFELVISPTARFSSIHINSQFCGHQWRPEQKYGTVFSMLFPLHNEIRHLPWFHFICRNYCFSVCSIGTHDCFKQFQALDLLCDKWQIV